MRNKKSLEEKIILICEFMGIRKDGDNFILSEEYQKLAKSDVIQISEIEEFKFNTDIKWQMPVLKKIQDIGCCVHIDMILGGSCQITKGSFKEPLKFFKAQANEIEDAIFETIIQVLEYFSIKQKDDQISNRCSILYNLKFNFDGENYIYQDINTTTQISEMDLVNLSIDEFNGLCREIQETIKKSEKDISHIKLTLHLNNKFISSVKNAIENATHIDNTVVFKQDKIQQLSDSIFRIENGFNRKTKKDNELSKS